MSDLERLRAEARALNERARRKIRRLERVKGAKLEGTKLDPRNPRVDKLTTKQLESQIAKAKDFISRRTQYVGGVQGTPIRADKWKAYRQAEVKHNKAVDAILGKYGQVELPYGADSNTTVEHRLRMLSSSKRALAKSNRMHIMTPVNRDPQNIVDEKRLAALKRDLERRSGDKATQKMLRSAKKSVDKMTDIQGDKEILKKLRKLTPEQFLLLWNFTDFPSALNITYQNIKDKLDGRDKPYYEQQTKQSMREYNTLIDWAAKQK